MGGPDWGGEWLYFLQEQLVNCHMGCCCDDILVFVFGGPVFILVTLLSLTANLTGTMWGWHELEPGAASWEWMYPLGAAFRGSTGISYIASVRSCCKVSLLNLSRWCPTGWWQDTHTSGGDSWSSTWLFWRAPSFLASGWMSPSWVFQDSSYAGLTVWLVSLALSRAVHWCPLSRGFTQFFP